MQAIDAAFIAKLLAQGLVAAMLAALMARTYGGRR
jgi:hypothetical protein